MANTVRTLGVTISTWPRPALIQGPDEDVDVFLGKKADDSDGGEDKK